MHNGSRPVTPWRDTATLARVAALLGIVSIVFVVRLTPHPRALESDDEFGAAQHAQQPRVDSHPGMQFSQIPYPWYTSASQQDEKWGGVRHVNSFPNAAQNAYLYAQHVAQSHTGQLLRWRNYVAQRRSDATPKEQLAQAKGMDAVARAEYNQARVQLAALKKLAVVRRQSSKRQDARQLTTDVRTFANHMLRDEDLAQVKRKEAYGKIEDATKILNKMARSGLIRRRRASARIRHAQQLSAPSLLPDPRGPRISHGHQKYLAYGSPPVVDCMPAGASFASDRLCPGISTSAAAAMLARRLHADEQTISVLSMSVNRLQQLDNKLLEERAQREHAMQVNASKGLPIY
jgi:hypothetical protein